METTNVFQKHVPTERWYLFLKQELNEVAKIEKVANNMKLSIAGHEFDLIESEVEPGLPTLYRLSTWDSTFKTSKLMTQKECLEHIMQTLFKQHLELLNLFDLKLGIKRMHANHDFDALQSFNVKKELAQLDNQIELELAIDKKEAIKKQVLEEQRMKLREKERERYRRKRAQQLEQAKQKTQHNNCTPSKLKRFDAMRKLIVDAQDHYGCIIESASRDMKRTLLCSITFKAILLDKHSQTDLALTLHVSQPTLYNKLAYLYELYKTQFALFVEFVEHLPDAWNVDVNHAIELIKAHGNRNWSK